MRALLKVISILLSVVCLLGCTSRVFQRKVECEKYASRILQEYRESPGIPGSSPGDYYVERVFYSPKRDSCICVLGNGHADGKDIYIYDIYIIDALTMKLLLSRRYKSTADIQGMADDIQAQVERYE